MNTKGAYTYLIFAFSFYLVAQAIQQYILMAGPAAGVRNLHESILVSRHPLNLLRHGLIYASMFLVLPAFVILAAYYLPVHKWFSWLAMISFSIFCMIEIGYRSVYLFKFLRLDAKAYALASTPDQALLLPGLQQYFSTIELIYIPLLLALMLGSLFLMFVSVKAYTTLVTIAMAVTTAQNASRLAGYTPFKYLNVFTGFWYFIPVALSFTLLIVAAVKFRRMKEHLQDH